MFQKASLRPTSITATSSWPFQMRRLWRRCTTHSRSASQASGMRRRVPSLPGIPCMSSMRPCSSRKQQDHAPSLVNHALHILPRVFPDVSSAPPPVFRGFQDNSLYVLDICCSTKESSPETQLTLFHTPHFKQEAPDGLEGSLWGSIPYFN